MEKDRDYYQGGATFAKEVQEGLKNGKTFDEMLAFEPGDAAHIRDLYKDLGNEDFVAWYKGYISRWD